MADRSNVDPKVYPLQRELQNKLYNWKCLICEKVALSPVKLQAQYLNKKVLLRDLNGEAWVKCERCQCPLHVLCDGDTEENVEKVDRYLCSFLDCEMEVLGKIFCYNPKNKHHKPLGPKY